MNLATNVENVYNPAHMPKIMETDLLELAGIEKLDIPSFCESVRKEAKLEKKDIAEKLGITVRAYDQLVAGDSKTLKGNTLLSLLLIRAKTRSINLKGFFL